MTVFPISPFLVGDFLGANASISLGETGKKSRIDKVAVADDLHLSLEIYQKEKHFPTRKSLTKGNI